MITLLKKIDKTYGGYEYIEIDHENNKFKIGNSRAHVGHYSTLKRLEVAVASGKELKEARKQVESLGYTLDENYGQ